MSESLWLILISSVSGLAGVLVGAGISWLQTYWFHRQDNVRNARYLAIRVVCILNKYLEDCVSVIQDVGVPTGDHGCYEPEVLAPDAPIFPSDVDWKSIPHDLMYRILAFPSEVEAAKNAISFDAEHASPPDYDEYFDSRAVWHTKLGWNAHEIIEEICKTYDVPKKNYDGWDPISFLKEKLEEHKQRNTPVITEAA